MLEALREPRTLLFSIVGGVALVATGFFAPVLIFGQPGVDTSTTGSVRAAVAATPVEAAPAPVDVATVTPSAPVRLAPMDTPTADIPVAVDPVSRGSLAFRSALAMLETGEHDRAFHLARAIADDAERRAIQWAAVREGNGRIDYESVIRFVDDAPGFAADSTVKTRLEQALTRADAAGPEIIRRSAAPCPIPWTRRWRWRWPMSPTGRRRAARIARTIWIDNFLSRDEENCVHKRLARR